jgi:hypothetical protein
MNFFHLTILNYQESQAPKKFASVADNKKEHAALKT